MVDGFECELGYVFCRFDLGYDRMGFDIFELN